ncbi:hypothetical protein LSAT2_021530 [Lamellibrachia satsuma]|nr:hypothetical protein LSAT2_021530 [Lamellibrachia satsuma]
MHYNENKYECTGRSVLFRSVLFINVGSLIRESVRGVPAASCVDSSGEYRAIADFRQPSAYRRSNPPKKPNFNPTPPKSTPKTAVWHWELDGVPTTVMFSVERNEVWCNGEVVDTTEDFSGLDGGDGASLEFYILIDETGSCHKANIRRSRSDGAASTSHHQRLSHDLFVDGYMIIEHGNGSRPGSVVALPPYTTPEPPPYEYAVSDLTPLNEDKKTK